MIFFFIVLLKNMFSGGGSSYKDKYEAETDIVKKLKNFAKKYNALVHLVAHPRKSMNEEIENLFHLKSQKQKSA